MSDFKFSPDLFLEVVELEKFKDFLDTEGFRKNILQNTVKFGLIKTIRDKSFSNGRIERDLNTSIGQKTVKMRALQAIDNQGLFLSSPEINSIAIPSDGKWYWIKVNHRYSTIEQGTVSLSINGDLTGSGTKFTKTLRGNPNFPSRIRFDNSKYNTLEYDVLEVIDDEHATILHPALNGTGIATFEIEKNLKFSVVGTFTPDKFSDEEDKYPFQYDSINLEVIAEEILNTRPDYIEEQEFYLARVKIQDEDVVIQDKRIEFWETKGSNLSFEVELKENPLIGIEAIKWQNILSPADFNSVYIAWGMRSQNWAIDSSKNIITFFGSATGGKFKTVDDFTDGDFDGWRVYSANGNFSRVISSLKQGQAINLVLDVLDVDNFSSDGGLTFNNQGEFADWVLVVPDCEEIEIQFTPNKLLENNNTGISYCFPINEFIGRCDVQVYKNPTVLFNVKYRYKTEKSYTQFKTLPEDRVGYYLEQSFDTNGNLRIEEDRRFYPYSPKQNEGYIQLTISPNAYSILIDLIYKGDIIGVHTIETFEKIQIYELQVGRDKRYQYIVNNITLTDDLYISLSSKNAQEGNEFRIHFNCNSIYLNEKKIYIIRDYTGGSPVVMKEITQSDIYMMYNTPGGIVFDCVFSDRGTWEVVYQNYSMLPPGEIIMIDGVIPNLFNANGWGKVEGLIGYAICNGANDTPDLRDRFVVGAGGGYNVGDKGGENAVSLTSSQIPPHWHWMFSIRPDGNNGWEGDVGPDDYVKRKTRNGTNSNNYDLSKYSGAPTVGRTSTGGGGNEAHENRPPYYALIYAKRMF